MSEEEKIVRLYKDMYSAMPFIEANNFTKHTEEFLNILKEQF